MESGLAQLDSIRDILLHSRGGGAPGAPLGLNRVKVFTISFILSTMFYLVVNFQDIV